ncbi:hypothetical protein QL285_095108 [Trifolium repens]|nr:hypothetical protein QL285_095108 [Trifolium repens]
MNIVRTSFLGKFQLEIVVNSRRRHHCSSCLFCFLNSVLNSKGFDLRRHKFGIDYEVALASSWACFLEHGLDNPLMQGTQMELSSWISATAFAVMGTIKT